MDNQRFSCFCFPKYYMFSICENPYILIIALNINICFIYMNEWAFQYALDQRIFG